MKFNAASLLQLAKVSSKLEDVGASFVGIEVVDAKASPVGWMHKDRLTTMGAVITHFGIQENVLDLEVLRKWPNGFISHDGFDIVNNLLLVSLHCKAKLGRDCCKKNKRLERPKLQIKISII